MLGFESFSLGSRLLLSLLLHLLIAARIALRIMPLQKMPYVPFVERPEWSDLQPVPQDDIPGALAAISYKPECAPTLASLFSTPVSSPNPT